MHSIVRPKVDLVFKRIKRAPVFTITRRGIPPTGRSVGFVFDTFPDGRHVLASVGHALDPENDPRAYRFGLLDAVTELTIEQYLTPNNPADDVAFFIAKPVEGFDPIRFERPNNEKFLPAVVYNSCNAVGSGGPPLILGRQSDTIKIHTNLVIMAAPWKEMKAEGDARVKTLQHTDEEGIRECTEKGWSRMNYMTLFSRPGFSGSPIWDDRWNLYGMGVRGTKSWKNEDTIGDFLAYYPASTLDRLWKDLRARHEL
ncbi:MAG TPA: hypothetical protein VG753_00350 [Candidatus Paceibacterota bacterium]|nr:hypothetical protein [Candidatus Paceibacterota bacterium]